MHKLSCAAIEHRSFGCPVEVLSLIKVHTPALKPNEILIQLEARAINPSDLLSIQGIGPYQKTKLPAIPGFEGVGIVVEKGKDVFSPNIGERVVSMKMKGSWQEYMILVAEEAVVVPETMFDSYAAQLTINPLTAWLMISRYQFKKGDIVVGNAANSSMGKLFAQFSQIFGYTFIGIVRQDIYIESLQKLGASLVVNSEDKDYKNKILCFTGGKKPNIGVEAIGGAAGEKLIRLLAPVSHLILYGTLSLSLFSFPILEYIKEQKIKISQFHLREWIHSTAIEHRKYIFNKIINTMMKYKILLPIGGEFKLSMFKEAILATQQKKSGKIILINP